MKSKTLLGIFAAIVAIAAIVALCLPAAAFAQAEAATPAAAPVSPTVGGDVLAALAGVVPGWIVTALSIFGTVSIGYQALIAWAHQRAAATADPKDDQWIAELETKAWFRILDRVFYWGGYLGAKLGGKKL
jgi:cytochrome c-type biogenesis protein CcmH/NrfG